MPKNADIELAIYEAVKARLATQGIDATDSIIQQAVIPDEMRSMRVAIEAYEACIEEQKELVHDQPNRATK